MMPTPSNKSSIYNLPIFQAPLLCERVWSGEWQSLKTLQLLLFFLLLLLDIGTGVLLGKLYSMSLQKCEATSSIGNRVGQAPSLQLWHFSSRVEYTCFYANGYVWHKPQGSDVVFGETKNVFGLIWLRAITPTAYSMFVNKQACILRARHASSTLFIFMWHLLE